MKNNEMLDNFIQYLYDNEKSNKTIKAYNNDILQFIEYNKSKYLHKIKNQDLKEYKEYLLYDRMLEPTSVNRKLVAIHQFLIFNEIVAKTKNVKVQNQQFMRNLINKKEIDKLIRAAMMKKDIRTKALILTGYLTGARVSEVLQIKTKDINSQVIRILGKGSKFRNLYIPKKLNDVWNEYYNSNKRYKNSDNLFTGQRGKLTPSGVTHILKKYSILSGVPKEKCHYHNLRHAFVVNSLLDKHLDITIVQSLVGHQSIQTTAGYSRVTEEELLELIDDLD